MPYDNKKEPPYSQEENVTYGNHVEAVTPSDTVDQIDQSGRYFKYFTTLTAGAVAVLGYKNGDADTPVVMNLEAGAVVPGRVRRLMATGTTATLAGWSD